MKIIKYLSLLIFLIGCVTLSNTATIEKTETGVKITVSQPASVTMEKDGEKYTFDSKSESLISKIVSILTFGAIGARR